MRDRLTKLYQEYVGLAEAERTLLARYSEAVGTGSKAANYTEGRLGVYEEVVADLREVLEVTAPIVCPTQTVGLQALYASPVVLCLVLFTTALGVSSVYALVRVLLG